MYNKFAMNLAKFKKIHSDKDFTTMQHDDGHIMKIAHKALSPNRRKEVLSMAEHKMADGGKMAGNPKEGYKRQSNPKLEQSKIHFADGGAAKGSQEAIDAENAESDADRASAPSPKASPEASPSPEPSSREQKVRSDIASHFKAEGGEIAPDAPAPQAQMNPEAAPTPEAVPPMAPAPQDISAAPGQPAQMPEAEQPTGQQQKVDSMLAQSPNGASAASGFQKQVEGAKGEAEAQSKEANDQRQILLNQAKFMSEGKEAYDRHLQDLNQERLSLQQDILDKHIDPNHYLGSQDTGRKIGTAIGLILGGLGGGMTGQGNDALRFLNSQIDRDIEAQKLELGKKENLLSANLRQYGNIHDATQMTTVMMNDMISSQLKAAAAKAQSPLAKANALKTIGALEQQVSPLIQQQATKQMLGEMGSKSNLVGADPAQFVSSVVPPDRQKEVFAEIERAQDTKRMGSSILKAFDQATKENTVLKTGAGLVRTPGSVYALHQAMQPTFKDLEGTVRQAAMDNTFKNITPMPGDTQHTIDQKKEALKGYLQSKTSAPTAKGFGIDLQKFESSAAPGIGEVKTFNGAKYQKVQNGWKKIQ